jgi:hypothetical protein
MSDRLECFPVVFYAIPLQHLLGNSIYIFVFKDFIDHNIRNMRIFRDLKGCWWELKELYCPANVRINLCVAVSCLTLHHAR